MKKSIGIIGGMGPQASADLYQKINNLAVTKFEVKSVADFPNLLISSLPVADFISSPKRKSEVLAMVKNSVSNFQEFGVDSFAIACNTAHLLVDELLVDVDLPFISMIAAVVDKVVLSGKKKVGLLASPTTIKTKLYQNELERVGLSVVLPQGNQLGVVEENIRAVIAGALSSDSRARFVEVMNDLFDRGAEVIILGCTELPLVVNVSMFGNRVLSSTDILAEKIVDIYYNEVQQ